MKDELNKNYPPDEEGYNDEVNKSSRLTKIIMPIILMLVLGIVAYTIYSFFLSSNETKQNNVKSMKEETGFNNEEEEPFFMDSPADALDKLHKEQEAKINKKDNEINAADELFDKEMLLDEKQNKKSGSFSNLEPIAPTTLAPATSKEIIEKATNSEILAPTPIIETKYQTTEHLKNNNLELFIQTGTFLKYKPNEKFLNSIQELGLSYKIDIYLHNNQSITRVLVGPFKTKSEANEALLSIREKIAKDAFILKTRLH